MLGFWNSASAISAAFFIDCAARPALPEADSGRTNATLTCPVPTARGCCAGPGAGPACELNGLDIWSRLCCAPEQAPSRGAPRIRPTAVRRVAPEEGSLGFSGATITSLLSTDERRSARPDGGFRHIVGEKLSKTIALYAPHARQADISAPFSCRRPPAADQQRFVAQRFAQGFVAQGHVV